MRIASALLVATLASVSTADAMDEMTFHMVRGEIDYGNSDNGDRLSWDGAAWIGGDTNKLWLKSEGEMIDGNTGQNETWALYSRRVSDYFNLQAGLRQDFEPESLSHLAVGIEGLAPYMFETEAFALVSDEGDVSARLKQSIDFLLTQRLIATPHAELNLFAQDVPKLEVGGGLSDLELGLQVRYEIIRKFAPYIDLVWEKKLGETAAIANSLGEDTSNLAVVAGIRFWF